MNIEANSLENELKIVKTMIDGYKDKLLTCESIIESKKEQLAKIAQHKKSLIYEYVTGKKRVKEAHGNGN